MQERVLKTKDKTSFNTPFTFCNSCFNRERVHLQHTVQWRLEKFPVADVQGILNTIRRRFNNKTTMSDSVKHLCIVKDKYVSINKCIRSFMKLECKNRSLAVNNYRKKLELPDFRFVIFWAKKKTEKEEEKKKRTRKVILK